MIKTLWIAFALTAVLFLPASASAESSDSRVISVSGHAEVRVPPDQVILTLGVESLSHDLAEAKHDNDRRVEKIIALARHHGVPEDRIATDFLQIRPDYDGRHKPDKPPVYVVQRSIVVTLAEIAGFEALLSNALVEGANYVHGIEFRTTELRKHRDTARRDAIKAAREKAELLAGELGLTVGPALRVQEGSGGWWSSYGRGWGGGRMGMMAQNVSQAGGSAEGGDALSPGQIAVSAQVSITFALQ